MNKSSLPLTVAKEMSARVGGRAAQVRHVFLARPSSSAAPTPMMSMMRGGRTGEVRLKLMLTLLWIAAAPPYEARFPARVWAEAIGLPDAGRNGARRVRQAIDWLVEHELISKAGESGHALTLRLLDESGTGRDYVPPGLAIKNQLDKGGSFDERDLYVKVPAEIWTEGWMGRLSGTALAMLLVLLAEQGRDDDKAVWISPRVARGRYDLSDSFRNRGVRDLEATGLVSTERAVTAGSSLTQRRYRNVYRVHRRVLADAGQPTGQ